MKNKKRMVLSVFWIALGILLTVLNAVGVIDDYWGNMGNAFILVGIIQSVRHIRYLTSKDYREKLDTSLSDERNRFIAGRAWAWAGYCFVLITAVASIILKIAGRDSLSTMAACQVSLLVFIYWVSYLFLSKKY